MVDTLVTISGCLVQHGKLNQRVYLIRPSLQRGTGIAGKLLDLADIHEYGKIVAKIPGSLSGEFEDSGFQCEAKIPCFFNRDEDCLFMAAYPDNDRSREEFPGLVKEVLEQSLIFRPPQKRPRKGHFTSCTPDDAREMAALYSRVFETYPFPINDPGYLTHTMDKRITEYFCIRDHGVIVSVGSAEKCGDYAVEMTDLATLPGYEGNGYAADILAGMEELMRERGIPLAYTICRAYSSPVNRIFSRRGYIFGGTLTRNTQICGRIESMNVWYKHLFHGI